VNNLASTWQAGLNEGLMIYGASKSQI